MKHIIILSLLFLVSCYYEEEKSIVINLDDRMESIQYSQFAKSLDYIKLEDDSCLISEIERIYIDGDTICLLDRKKGGI